MTRHESSGSHVGFTSCGTFAINIPLLATFPTFPTFNTTKDPSMKGFTRAFRTAATTMSLTETQLIRSAQAGDRVAFDRLVRLHADDLTRFVAKRVNPECLDDVVQNTWIAAWSSIERFSIKAKFRTWLFAIALNKCHDVYRQRAAPDQLVDQGKDEEAYSQIDLKSSVGLVLDQLEEQHRELLDLYYFEDLTMPEIAQVTGRNLNTVKYQFYRAHQEFARIMERGQ